MEPRRYRPARGAIHSLEHLDSLSDTPRLILCVSERTLNILQNYAALDATFRARYAQELDDYRYLPVSEGESYWNLFNEVVRNLQLELAMSCEITAVLEQIRDAIKALVATQSDVIFQQSICCGDGVTPTTYYPADPVPDIPPLDEDKCKRAYTVALNWSEAAYELFRQYKFLGGTIGVGVVALITTALAPPLAVVVAVTALIIGATAVLELSDVAIEGAINDLVDDVACAVYASSNVEAAQAALDALLATPTILGASGTGALRELLSSDILNGVFDETGPIRSDAPGDCSGCGSAGCDGVYEFGSSVDPLDGPYGGPGDETLLWSGGPGYDGASGRAVLDNPAPEIGNDVYLEIPVCEETLVSEGGAVSIRVNAPAQGSNENNVYLKLITDTYGDINGGNVVCDGTWQTASLTVPAGADGDGVVALRIIFYKYGAALPVSLLLDHLVISL